MFVITGKIVVAKNPCLHPGDMRILIANDVSLLHHMVDCCFPTERTQVLFIYFHDLTCTLAEMELFFIHFILILMQTPSK